MSTLRELVVNIDFEGLDVRKLLKIDSAVDEIEDSFRDMGGEINKVTASSAAMGTVAENALENIQVEAVIAAAAVDRLGDQFGQAAFKATLLSAAMGGVVAAGIASSGPLLAATGALTASLAAAGIGAGAFGAVAVGLFTDFAGSLEEVAAAEEKLANAKTHEERIAAYKELAAIYDEMGGSQRGALKDLREFQGFWSGFIKQFEDPVFKSFSNVLNATQTTLEKLAPTISNVGDVVVGLTDDFNKALDTAGASEFFNWLETNAATSLDNLVRTLSNFTAGLGEMLMAFDPITKDFEGGFLAMSERFKEWAGDLQNNQSFQNFIEYAKENGPILVGIFGEIIELGKNIVAELAPIGSIVLDGFKDLTEHINDNWENVETLILAAGAAVGSFVVMMKGLQIVGAVNALFTAWRAGTAMQTLAMWGLNTAMLANPLTWIVAGIAAVIGIGVALYKNWDTVKEKAGILWDWIKEKFAGIKDATEEFIKPVVDMFENLGRKWDNFKSSLSNFKMPSLGLPKWMGGNGVLQFDGSHATGLENVPKNNYAANLHKGEAVLRADQANALRGAGILGKNGSKPAINMPSGGGFSPSVTINVSGGGNADEIAKAVNRELEKFWLQMSLKQA